MNKALSPRRPLNPPVFEFAQGPVSTRYTYVDARRQQVAFRCLVNCGTKFFRFDIEHNGAIKLTTTGTGYTALYPVLNEDAKKEWEEAEFDGYDKDELPPGWRFMQPGEEILDTDRFFDEKLGWIHPSAMNIGNSVSGLGAFATQADRILPPSKEEAARDNRFLGVVEAGVRQVIQARLPQYKDEINTFFNERYDQIVANILNPAINQIEEEIRNELGFHG